MDDERIIIGLAIAELVLRYGAPAALQVMRDWEKDDPTMEDIQALKNRVPHPSTYISKPKRD